MYEAGVEGALRAYEVLRQSRSDADLPLLDDLLRKRDRSELLTHVAGRAAEKCPTSHARLIAPPIGAAVGTGLALLVTYWSGRRRASATAEPLEHSTTRTPTIFRTIVLGCAAYYLLVAVALHFLEPTYDPRYQFMSDYAWSAHGWLMTTTFFALGLGVLTVAMRLRNVHQTSRGARLGVALLAVAALFLCLAGVFRGFPLHDAASAVGIPSLVLAAVLLSWSFRNAAGWGALYLPTLLVSVGMAAAIVSMFLDVGMPGLQQRAFLFLTLVWLSLVACRLPG